MVTMEMGAGPPVLLVHGLNGFKEGWGRLPAALARAGHRVVAVDLPGFGETPPLRAERATPEALARALAPLVAELAPVGIVAHSLGTQPALLLAIHQPERVRSAVLIGPWVTPRHGRFPPRGLADLLQLPLLGRGLARAAIRRARRRPERRRAAFLGQVAEPDRVGDRPELEALLQAAADRLLGADVRTMVVWAESGVEEDLRPLAPRVAVPTLVVAGADDRLTPPAAADRLAGALPAGRVLHVARAGHFPHLERPEVVTPQIVEHMA
jgi:pimeloyl-ACP methyl ester carboxylesterase